MSATRPLIQAAFEPLTGEHRMELVAEKDGVRYINNSRAISINAAWYALELMPKGRRVHWLVGGDVNGSEHMTEAWRAMLPTAREKVKVAYDISLPSPAQEAFHTVLWDHIDAVTGPFISLWHAVMAARAMAEPGDIVLLNPGRCSLDHYRNHEARGDEFKQAVAAI